LIHPTQKNPPRSGSPDRGKKTKKNMKNAVWFSRHQPTNEQIADASAMGFKIVAIEPGKVLGAVDIRDNGDVKSVVSGVLAQVAEHRAEAVFGVPSAPILAQLARTAADAVQRGAFESADVPFFAAWNVSRSVEGGRPTFSHKSWCLIGHLGQASCRWLV
jgi:hypothetical protein